MGNILNNSVVVRAICRDKTTGLKINKKREIKNKKMKEINENIKPIKKIKKKPFVDWDAIVRKFHNFPCFMCRKPPTFLDCNWSFRGLIFN